ncbi:aspartate carbamoyltransferase [Vulcanisaeta thermophila]|uniref:aspartate carbamoyltransferase n=1 Tax=Vulcanisaeta thermophila TaxID=867917 RepID=UPI000853A1C1|nr:aspartate carbamoyltransferase [Vulcanisaeta thermophila]
MGWLNRDVITVLDFTREDLETLFSEALEMEKYAKSRLNILSGKVLAVAFFEPSTRTRLSFETAMIRLGGSVIGFSGAEATSMAKGENLADTIRMLDSYANAIVIRHSLEGAAKFAAEVAESPVINAGDGSRNHPTQAMLDLYTIWREFKTIDGLSIGVLGDLRYARVVTSLIQALSYYRVRVHLISPEPLKPRQELLDFMVSRGMSFDWTDDPYRVIDDLDVLYVVRIQKERFPDPVEYERVRGAYKVDMKLLERAKPSMIILHPLPRVDEVDPAVDSSPHARYFRQAALGVPLRMALLKLILGGES